MTILSTMDILALGWFLSAWIAFNIAVELTPLRNHTLSHLMERHRRGWMTSMSRRTVRIMDVGIASGLQQGTAFFASTSLLAIGGCFALLTSREAVFNLLSDLGVTNADSPAVWELKVIGLALIYAYAFFKFGWAYRLFNYATILMGAVPDRGDGMSDEDIRTFAIEAGEMNVLAGRHFNRGQRAFFFSIGYLGWFADPRLFALTTLFVLFVLIRRQFVSRARSIAASAHQLPSPPIAANGGVNTSAGSSNPLS